MNNNEKNFMEYQLFKYIKLHRKNYSIEILQSTIYL